MKPCKFPFISVFQVWGHKRERTSDCVQHRPYSECENLHKQASALRGTLPARQTHLLTNQKSKWPSLKTGWCTMGTKAVILQCNLPEDQSELDSLVRHVVKVIDFIFNLWGGTNSLLVLQLYKQNENDWRTCHATYNWTLLLKLHLFYI